MHQNQHEFELVIVAPEPTNSFEEPETYAIPEVEDSKEAHNDSKEAAQSRRTFKYGSAHPEGLIIGSKDSSIKAISTFRNESLLGLISLVEPTFIDEALTDDGWIVAMQEELNQFQRNVCLGFNCQTPSEEYHWNNVGLPKQT